MRTFLDLPDELLREAKITAIRRGITLRELVSNALSRELYSGLQPQVRSRRVLFPVIRSGAAGHLTISRADLDQAEHADDLGRSGMEA